MTQPEPPTEQQLDNITAKVAELRERLDRKNPWPSDNESYFVAEGWANGTRNALDKLDPSGLVAEIRRLRAKTRTLGELAARRESELIARRAELADAEAEKAKLIRWHCEDGTTLDRMRDTIVRLRAELATAQAAPEATSAPLAASQPSEAPVEPDTATRASTGRTGDPRRTLTPTEYDAAWHAVEGAAGDEGADPGTILHAVLNRLGIEWQDAASTV